MTVYATMQPGLDLAAASMGPEGVGSTSGAVGMMAKSEVKESINVWVGGLKDVDLSKVERLIRALLLYLGSLTRNWWIDFWQFLVSQKFRNKVAQIFGFLFLFLFFALVSFLSVSESFVSAKVETPQKLNRRNSDAGQADGVMS